MPSARFYDESVYGITFYNGDRDQKITFTSNPFDWLEASFFYMNIEERQKCRSGIDNSLFCQGYKDKGFNFKLRIKEEGKLPAIAIGFNDIAGTGYYSSEYIVGNYGIGNTDLSFGIGWGYLNGSKESFKNPFGIFGDSFYERPINYEGFGGELNGNKYFSGKTASPFFGISHIFNEKVAFKAEYDSTLTPGKIGHEPHSSDFSFGFEFYLTENTTIALSTERGNFSSLKFIFKNNPIKENNKKRFKKGNYKESDSNYRKFINNLEKNGLGVNKLIEGSNSIGVELTQFAHPNLDIIEEIIYSASQDAGLNKEIRKDLRIADLQAYSDFDNEFDKNNLLIYERKPKQRFNSKNQITFRPFLASREDFFKGAILFENNSEYVIRDNFFFTSNLKYSLVDNFEDLTIPPVNTYPAQVRSDIKDYLRNYDDGIFIGRAQFDYHLSPKKNHHLMFTAGILEEMFNGAGFEYLFYEQNSNYAVGFEIFEVQKRDYKMRFGTLDYSNLTGHLNFYHRNYGRVPFDLKISYGEYIAGDEGLTLDLSRSFSNGTKFGIFASFTDVSSEQFGEGSFDKGIYFNVPVFGNFINYSWRPLTKDPAAKLIRKNTLYDLLVKFRPIN